MKSLEIAGSIAELPREIVDVIMQKKVQLEQGEEVLFELGHDHRPLFTVFYRLLEPEDTTNEPQMYVQVHDGENVDEYPVGKIKTQKLVEDLVDALAIDFNKSPYITIRKRKDCIPLFHRCFEPVIEDEDEPFEILRRELKAQVKSVRELAKRWVFYILPS